MRSGYVYVRVAQSTCCAALALLAALQFSWELHEQPVFRLSAVVVGCVSWSLCALLTAIEARAHLASSWLLRAWLVAHAARSGLAAGFSTRASSSSQLNHTGQLCATCAPGVLLALLVLFESETPSPSGSPDATASIWSVITYGWLSPVLSLGATHALEQTDLPPLGVLDGASVNADALQVRSQTQLSAAPGRADRISP